MTTESGAPNIRFFGKIYGTAQDYYIAEGTLEAGEEDQEERGPDFEARGTGVNKFVYWVTDNILSKWTKLPDLTPQDIRATREIKVTFTGNLERQIFTNPFFFGTEKIYLRAQIARLTHSTTLCPKGLWKLDEENPQEIVENAPDDGSEIQMPSTLEMAKS